jgi:hypothetical protein
VNPAGKVPAELNMQVLLKGLNEFLYLCILSPLMDFGEMSVI